MGLGKSKQTAPTVRHASASQYHHYKHLYRDGSNVVLEVKRNTPSAARVGYAGNVPKSAHSIASGRAAGPKGTNLNQHKSQQQHQRHHINQQQQHSQQTLHPQRNKRTAAECNVCGHEGHSGAHCFHRHMTCRICNEPGHLASVCKEKHHHPASAYKPQAPQVRKNTHHRISNKP